MAREPIKKSVRFEVFKRDSFTCQYCGLKAPDVVLEVDHITPVAEGGDNDLLNLVTACRSCNSGKRDKLLSDASAVNARRSQLEDLEERRQQLEMLHQWHLSLVDLDHQAAHLAGDLWFQSTGREGSQLTDEAAAELQKLIKRHGFERVCNAIREAAESAMRASDREKAYREMFWKIGRIISVQQTEEREPGIKRLFYIRGILRNRCPYLNENTCMALLREAKDVGLSLDWLEGYAKQVRSWSQFRNEVRATIDEGHPDSAEATDGTNP